MKGCKYANWLEKLSNSKIVDLDFEMGEPLQECPPSKKEHELSYANIFSLWPTNETTRLDNVSVGFSENIEEAQDEFVHVLQHPHS